MPAPDTDSKLAAGYARLVAEQQAGTAPPPGQVSLALYAQLAGTDPKTVAAIERRALAKLAHALLCDPEARASLSPLMRRRAAERFPHLFPEP